MSEDHFKFTHQDVQRNMRALIEECRSVPQERIPSKEETLPLALELWYTAIAMKPRYVAGAEIIARRYCERVGLDPKQVEEFAATRVYAHMNSGEDCQP